MEKSLDEILAKADRYHNQLLTFCVVIKPSDIEDRIIDLQNDIRTLQGLAKHLADISNLYNTVLLQKRSIGSIKYIDTYPTENDHVLLREKETKELVPGLDIPVKTVDTLKEIPISYMYYVEELKQYVINIGGVNIKGNLADIKDYGAVKSAICCKGITCENINECKFYHEPEDFIKMGLPVAEQKRVFTNGSWLYAGNKKMPYARHIGNGSTLLTDIRRLKMKQYNNEVNIREGQLIHDLLIYMTLYDQNMIKKYSHWIK